MTIATRLHHAAASNLNEDGKCKFGTKEYWDTMYNKHDGSSDNNTNEDGLSAEEYSWYCDYRELQPFWDTLVGSDDTNKEQVQVLIAGIEWSLSCSRIVWANSITATGSAKLLVADCRDLPIPTGTIDATLDKVTLDAIYITGKEVFSDSVKELTRVTATNGIIVCVSAVIPQEELLNAFQNVVGGSGGDCCWETVLDGGLAFADSGEATIDLGANMYSFRRR
eukprot:scaffold3726_cov148-Skeletonema_menzelii.AAC.2